MHALSDGDNNDSNNRRSNVAKASKMWQLWHDLRPNGWDRRLRDAKWADMIYEDVQQINIFSNTTSINYLC